MIRTRLPIHGGITTVLRCLGYGLVPNHLFDGRGQDVDTVLWVAGEDKEGEQRNHVMHN